MICRLHKEEHRFMQVLKPLRKRIASGEGEVFLLGFLVPVLIGLVGYIVIKVWPFGDGTVLIIDSLHQYLPFYTDFHEKLTQGSGLLYSFSGGFGYNFWSAYAYYLASPLNFLIALVPTKNVCDFMDYLILFKLGMCGGIFAWYLYKLRRNSRFLPVVFAVMYAMGNFLIGYYFNLMWLDSIAVVPLIMYGIEKITKGKSGLLYGVSLFYGLWCNYYIGFMLCLFSCLYLGVCLLEREGVAAKALVIRCLKFAWYSLLAGITSAMVLLPAFLSLTASEAMHGNSFPSKIKFYTDITGLLLAHGAEQHPINISDTQVGLNAYCGTAVLSLVLLFILNPRMKWRKKVGKLLLSVLFLLSAALNILNYIWHGFHVQNGLPNRFAFLYVVIMLVMAYEALQDLDAFNLLDIASAFLIPAAFFVLSIQTGFSDKETYGNWVWITPGLLIAYLLIFLACRLMNVKKSIAVSLIGMVLLAEGTAHGIYGYIYNENVTRSIYLEDQASYKNFIRENQPEGFFRSEFDSTRMRNVAMFAGATSTVMFNSTMQESVTEFCDRIGMEARTNKNGYIGVTELMNAVFGIRYIFSSFGHDGFMYHYPQIADDGNLCVYENEAALSLGFLADPALRDWDIYDGNPLDVQNSFVKLAAGMDPIYRLDRTVEAENGEEYKVKVPDHKQVYLYLPERASSMKLTTPEYTRSYTTYTDHLYCVNAIGEENQASFKLDTGKAASRSVMIYTCPDEDLAKVIEYLGQDQLEDVRIKGGRISGTIDCSRDGLLVLTVSHDKNWTIEVDGEETEFFPIGGMLTGLNLEKGTHEIRMRYMPAGFPAGLVMSLIGAAFFILSAVFEKKRKGQQQDTMELHFSSLSESFQPGIFALLNQYREEMEAQGKTIYNLSVGTPDFEPSDAVMHAVSEAALDPKNYRYSLRDLPELTKAVQDYYFRRFGVELKENEIMSIYGSQEGMAHIAWTVCDEGDLVLVPNPGYPIFKLGPQLCGAQVWEYPLTEENNYLPDLESIPEEIALRARMIVVNYPGNPLCKAAPDEFYEKLIAFAHRYGILILHDNAYADILFGERRGRSILEFDGAKETAVEFYSLSKTFDYTGARLSFVVGNADVIKRFQTIRSQIDYGIFYPVQYGAIAALNEPDDAVLEQCRSYEERSITLCEGLRGIGWNVPDSEGTMFVWAPLPEGYKNSEEFCKLLMKETGVICTPGSSFGSLGEGYVRFALVLPPEKLREAVESIGRSGLIKGKETTEE